MWALLPLIAQRAQLVASGAVGRCLWREDEWIWLRAAAVVAGADYRPAFIVSVGNALRCAVLCCAVLFGGARMRCRHGVVGHGPKTGRDAPFSIMLAGTAMHPHTTPITGSSCVPSQQKNNVGSRQWGWKGEGGWAGRVVGVPQVYDAVVHIGYRVGAASLRGAACRRVDGCVAGAARSRPALQLLSRVFYPS